MNADNLNTLVVILINGSLILLSFLMLSNPLKVNRKANFWFGVFLILWSSFWVDEVADFILTSSFNATVIFIGHFIQFFTPLVFYLSVVYFTNPEFRFKTGDVRFLVLPALYFIMQLFQIVGGIEIQAMVSSTILGLILFNAVFYILLSYLKIRKHKNSILQFSSDTKGISLNWLEYIIVLLLVMSVTVSFYNIFFDSTRLNVFINIAFLLVIYIVAYYSLKQKEIYPLDQIQRRELFSIIEQEQLSENKRKVVSDSELELNKNKLDLLMVEHQPYLDSELSLIRLAEMLSLTPHQLSYVINTGYNENYFQFINKFRVEKAKELLQDSSKENLTILGIAFESGFNSKTSFNTTFKKFTNRTPSEFKNTSSQL